MQYLKFVYIELDNDAQLNTFIHLACLAFCTSFVQTKAQSLLQICGYWYDVISGYRFILLTLFIQCKYMVSIFPIGTLRAQALHILSLGLFEICAPMFQEKCKLFQIKVKFDQVW